MLSRVCAVVLALSLNTAFVHAQAVGALRTALGTASQRSGLENAAKGSEAVLTKKALQSAVVSDATNQALMQGAQTSNALVPFSFYETPENIKAATVNMDNLKQTLQSSLEKANNPLEGRILTTEQKNTLSELDSFIQEYNLFPEIHFDEDLKGLSRKQQSDIAIESALRKKIDEELAAKPFSDFSKEIFAFHGRYAEKQLLTIEQVLHQVSPSLLSKVAALQSDRSSLRPVLIASSELPNAYHLTDNFYRGGQPTEEGYRMLSKMGIKTIISFRTHKPNKELIENLGMESVHIPLNPALITPAQMTRFLRVISNPARQPVYIHCRYGSDRTGAMVAAYRMAAQQWSQSQALTEMKNPHFDFHRIFFTLPLSIRRIPIGIFEDSF